MVDFPRRTLLYGIGGTAVAALTASMIASPASALRRDAAPDAPEDYSLLRQRWVDTLTGGTSYDPSDSRLAPKISAVTSTAQAYWASLETSTGRTSLWADLDLNVPGDSAVLTSTYRRVLDLARAFRTVGSTLQADPALAAAVIDCLDWLASHHFNAASTAVGNWWDWEIGVPAALTSTTVLMMEELTAKQVGNYMAAVDHFCSDPSVLHENTPGGLSVNTGYNLAAKAENVAVRSVALGDDTGLALASTSISPLFVDVETGDGFHPDGSFVFHDHIAYTGGYGRSMLAKIVGILHLLVASSTARPTDPARHVVYRWVTDSFAPFMFRGGMMGMVSGREISRESTQEHDAGHHLSATVARLSVVAADDGRVQDAESMRSLVKAWVQTDTYDDIVADPQISLLSVMELDDIVSDAATTSAASPNGCYAFCAMDRAVVWRDHYAFGVAAHSQRIQNYETIGAAENLRGWHTGNGMTCLYNSNLPQFDGDYWPTVDPYRLSGTTVVAGSAGTTRRFNASPWTGSVTLGGAGATGTWLQPFGQDLTAQKSWFMLGDEIVCLGSAITSSATDHVETVIDNRRLPAAGDSAITVDGVGQPVSAFHSVATGATWLHLSGESASEGIGYLLPEGADVHVLREVRTGRWSDINSRPSSSSDLRSNTFATFWFDHGSQPVDDGYAYVIVPGVTVAQTAALASTPAIEVLARTPQLHAVKHAAAGLTGATVWVDQPVTVDGISIDRRACVLVRRTAEAIEVALSDPTQLHEGPVDLTIDTAVSDVVTADDAVTVLQYRPELRLRVDLSGTRGAAVTAAFTRIGPEAANPAPPADGAVPDVVVVDNLDRGFATESVWETRTNGSGFYGDDYAFDGSSTASASGWAMWTPYLPRAGRYDVDMMWSSHANRPTTAPIAITHAGGTATSTVDQTVNGGTWVPVGSHRFPAGTTAHLRIATTAAGYTVADAVRFRRYWHRFEAESLTRSATGGMLSDHTDSAASNSRWSKFTGSGVGAYVDLRVEVPATGRYEIRLRGRTHHARARFQAIVDGVAIGAEVDQYSAGQEYTIVDLGVATLAAGERRIRLQVTGANPLSTGYTVSVDYLELAER